MTSDDRRHDSAGRREGAGGVSDTREEAMMGDRRTDEDIERDWENIKAITGMNDQPEVLTDDELIAALRERLAALVHVEDDGVDKAGLGHGSYGIFTYECVYCGAAADSVSSLTHAPDCPITLGRAALAEGGEQGGA